MSNTWLKREGKREVTFILGENKREIDFALTKKKNTSGLCNGNQFQ